MAESVAATASPKALLFEALRPHPGIGILKSWPGVVEMILRGTATVLSFLLLIPAAVAQDNVKPYIPFDSSFDALPSKTHSIAAWLLFVTIMAMLIEATIIALRFMNLGLVEKHTLPLTISDAVLSFTIAVCLFAGGTSMATCATTWSSSELVHFRIQRSTQAATVFSYFSMAVFTVIGVWVLVVYFALKWCVQGRYFLKRKGSMPQKEHRKEEHNSTNIETQ
eukprot:Em0018g986a